MTYGGSLFAAYYQQRHNDPLPSEYRRVECLIADSTPWIDVGFVHGVDDAYEVRAAAVVSSSAGVDDTKAVMGGGHSKTDSNFGLWLGQHPGKGVSATFGVGNAPYDTGYVSSVDVSVPHTYRTVLATAQLLVDGVLVGQATPGTYPNPRKLVLFGAWRQTSSSGHPFSYFKGSVYFFKAWRAGSLLRDMIPVVRISDNKPGLYDLCGSACPLTGTPFYVNSGTGEDFTWGELQ